MMPQERTGAARSCLGLLLASHCVARKPHSDKITSAPERLPRGAVAVASKHVLGAAMIRTLCTCVVLSGVAGLSGVVTGHLWSRYADENGLLRFSGVYQRILAAQAGFVADPRDRLVREASVFDE
jgi:hypothetical protein